MSAYLDDKLKCFSVEGHQLSVISERNPDGYSTVDWKTVVQITRWARTTNQSGEQNVCEIPLRNHQGPSWMVIIGLVGHRTPRALGHNWGRNWGRKRGCKVGSMLMSCKARAGWLPVVNLVLLCSFHHNKTRYKNDKHFQVLYTCDLSQGVDHSLIFTVSETWKEERCHRWARRVRRATKNEDI